MAEDDDDDTFGDFTFASFPSTSNHSNPTTQSSVDDVWGDFVNHSSSPQINTAFAKPFEPFGVSADPNPKPTSTVNGNHNNTSVAVREEKPSWNKPQGAIPLSIFGEEEEEAEPKEPTAIVFSDKNNGDSVKKGSHSKLDVAAPNLNSNGSILNFDLYNRNSGSVSVPDVPAPNLNSNGSNLNFDLFNQSTGAVSNSDVAALNLNSNGSNLNFDLFTQSAGAVSNSDVAAPILNSNGNNLNLDLFNQSHGSVLSSGVAAPNLNSNGSDLNLDSVDGNEDEDGWEFQSAEWENGTKSQDVKAHVADHNNGALVVGATLDSSSRVSDKAGGWHPEIEFSPSSTSQDHISSQLGQKSEWSEAETGFTATSHSFGELKNAHSGSGSNQNLEASKMADRYPTSVEALKFNDGSPHGITDPSLATESHQSNDLDFGFSFNSSSLGKDSHISETYSKTESSQDDNIEKNASSTNINVGWDVNLFESKGAVTEIRTEHEKPQVISENRREALPLSIFGDEMPDTNELPLPQDLSPFTPVSPMTNSFNSPGSNLSINDMIWSLYGQAENKSSPSVTPKASENGIHASPGTSGSNVASGDDDFDDQWDFKDASPATTFVHESAQTTSFDHAPQLSENGSQSPTVINSDLNNDDDNFEDDSWEFKDAASGTSQNQASVINQRDLPTQISTKLGPLDYVDFYSKLKDELCNVVMFHLQNLKNAQSVAALSGEDAKAKALQEEIQEFSRILHQGNLVPDEYLSENYSPRNVHFDEVLELLKESKFQSLESEYQLVSRLSMAKNDMKPAVEFLQDAASTLRILKLGTREEHSNYLMAWSKIAFACSQELKHGAYIWKQAVQNNVHDQILSNPKGVQYIHALGEIYRVAEIIGVSAKFHKPWVLLGSIDLESLFALLNECYSIWLSSGLEEALFNISNQNNAEPGGILRELIESIKYIHELDEHALQSYVISAEEITCQLSALPAGFIPGVKMVTWNGKHYFVMLANLWANLVSPDPHKK